MVLAVKLTIISTKVDFLLRGSFGLIMASFESLAILARIFSATIIASLAIFPRLVAVVTIVAIVAVVTIVSIAIVVVATISSLFSILIICTPLDYINLGLRAGCLR